MGSRTSRKQASQPEPAPERAPYVNPEVQRRLAAAEARLGKPPPRVDPLEQARARETARAERLAAERTAREETRKARLAELRSRRGAEVTADFEEVLDLVVDCQSVSEAADLLGVGRRTLIRYLRAPERVDRYKEALTDRGHASVLDALAAAHFNPDVTSALQWEGKVFARAEFGDKAELTVRDETPRVIDVTKLTHEERLQLRAIIAAAMAPPPSEADPTEGTEQGYELIHAQRSDGNH